MKATGGLSRVNDVVAFGGAAVALPCLRSDRIGPKRYPVRLDSAAAMGQSESPQRLLDKNTIRLDVGYAVVLWPVCPESSSCQEKRYPVPISRVRLMSRLSG